MDDVAVREGPAPPVSARLRRARDAFLHRREASVLIVAIGLVVYFQAATPIFLTPDNLRNIAQATAAVVFVVGRVVAHLFFRLDGVAQSVFALGGVFSFVAAIAEFLLVPVFALPLGGQELLGVAGIHGRPLDGWSGGARGGTAGWSRDPRRRDPVRAGNGERRGKDHFETRFVHVQYLLKLRFSAVKKTGPVAGLFVCCVLGFRSNLRRILNSHPVQSGPGRVF